MIVAVVCRLSKVARMGMYNRAAQFSPCRRPLWLREGHWGFTEEAGGGGEEANCAGGVVKAKRAKQS